MVARGVASACFAVMALGLLISCGDDTGDVDGQSPAAPVASAPSKGGTNTGNPCLGQGGAGTPPDSRRDAAEYVGLTEQQARARASEQQQTIRIAGRDGKCFVLTTDYRSDRVNLYLADGTVTSATLG